MMVFAFFMSNNASAVEDATAPQVTAFSFDKSEINTESSDDTLTLTISVTDDLTGVCIRGDCGDYIGSYTQLTLVSSTGGTQTIDFTDFERISGDALDGTYEVVATAPKGIKNGIWEVSNFLLMDKIGNFEYLNKDDIESQFGDGSAVINNTATVYDSSAPQITAFLISPSEINTESSDDSITLEVTLTDDLSGVCINGDCGSYDMSSNTQLSIKSAIGTQTISFTDFTRTSGDDLDGTYEATATVPRYSATGTWEVENFFLRDKLGNAEFISKEELESQFGTGSAEIDNLASVGDISAPQVTEFSINPLEINTESSSETLTLEVTLTDDLSGICIAGDCGGNIGAQTQLRIKPLIGTQTIDFSGFVRTSGDSLNGTYEATATIPANAKEGVWEVQYFYLGDQLGNTESLSINDLNSLFSGENLTIVNTAESSSVEVESLWNLNSETASVTFSPGTIVTKKEGGSFAFYQMVNQEVNIEEIPVDDEPDGDVIKTIRFGIPGIGLEFSEPVSISLNVGTEYNGSVLQISSLEDGDEQWSEEDECVVQDGLCSFSVTHASYFAAVELGSPIYRFYSQNNRSHFFTISSSEKDRIIATYPEKEWRYEGISWYVPTTSSGNQPVYRFYSPNNRSHFFTISATEKNRIIATYPETEWRYEGVAWYVPITSSGNSPVYRFYSQNNRSHFFTISSSEKDRIIATYPEQEWRYEGVAYYVPN